MSIMPIGFPVSPVAPIDPTLGAGAVAPAAGSATSGAEFGQALTQGLEEVQRLQSTADGLAVQAATGDLTDVHDYTIAATRASLATELTVAVRNKAVEAFTEIMRMPL